MIEEKMMKNKGIWLGILVITPVLVGRIK